MDPEDTHPSRIITFYSYKGGTGRTMAVANVAWILANSGKRVLTVDWDLDSPGLHSYFHPFLVDKELRSSSGVIDLVRGFAAAVAAADGAAAATGPEQAAILPDIDLLEHIVALDWDFPAEGLLHLMPAGQQGPAYSRAVNTFDWDTFYQYQRGAAFFEGLVEAMRRHYDYVLIDSPTGVNDIAGICTVELPDIVVDCFTLSSQSIRGAVAVAESVVENRSDRPVVILPVPMRVEYSENQKLDAGRDYARREFARFLPFTDGEEADRYWGEIEIPYRGFFAYEEILAAFGDRPHGEGTVLAACERLTERLTDGEVSGLPAMRERDRRSWLLQFERINDGKAYNVVITYASVNRTWAEWLAAELNAGGRTTRLQAIDRAEGPVALHELRTVVESARQHLAVLSQGYAAVPLAADLWAATAAGPADAERSRLVPVRVDGNRLPAPFNAHAAVDLVKEPEDRARAAIAHEFGLEEIDGYRETVPDAPRYPNVPPPIWNVPKRGVTAFVGRGDILELLRERLANAVTVMVPQALYGLGGVGKTQLAIEYAHRFGSDYNAVWWVRADQPSSARRGLIELAAKMRLPAGNTDDETLQDVLNALRLGTPRRWLVIFDNAEDPAAIRDLIPEGGHVLVTSRNNDWGQYGPALEIGTFNRGDSTRLLQSQAPTLTDAEAELVAKKLEDMPLALAQAATWLKRTGVPVDEYLVQLDTALAETLNQNEVPEYGRTVAATWQISLNRLREERPATAALLELCSFYGSDPVPVSMLKGPTFTEFVLRHDPGLEGRVSRAIQYVGEFMLARVDFASNSLQMHRLVRAVIQAQLMPDRAASMRQDALAILIAADPEDPDKPSNYPMYRELWPHAVAIDLTADDDPGARALMVNLTRFLYRTKEFAASRSLAREILGRWDRRFGRSEVTNLLLRFHLANALRSEGDYAEARKIDEDVWRQFTKNPTIGPRHRYTLLVAASRGADLRIAGRYSEAKELDRKTMEQAIEVLGEGAAETLRAINNYAVSLRQTGDFNQAAELIDRIYQTRRRLWGATDPDTLNSRGGYGRDLIDTGQLEEALEILTATFDTQRTRTDGETNPDTWRTARYAAQAMRELGLFHEAHRLIGEASERYSELYVPTHLDRMACDMVHASTFSAVDQNATAVDRGRDLLVRYRATLGDKHSFTTACENNVAIFLRKQNAVDEAARLSAHVLARLSAELGRLHPYTLFAALNRANDLTALGDFRAAYDLDNATAPALAEVVGVDHPSSLSARVNLALSALATGRPDAQAALDTAIGQLRRRFGHQNPRVTDARERTRINSYIQPPPA